MQMGKGFATVLAGSTAVLGLAACGSSDNSTGGGSASSTAATCNSPGVTASTITVGVLMPLSGSGVTQRAGWNDGVNAYFDMLNAAGGINHRTVNVVVDDDKSTAAGSLDGGKDLVENKNAFSIIEAPLQDGALDYLQAQGVPDIGHSTADVGAKHSNFFSIEGAVLPGTGSTALPQFMKNQGATSAANFTVSDPQATAAGQIFVKEAQLVGLNVGYSRFNVPFVPGDFTADAQQMKSKGIDAAALAITNNVAIALYKAAVQAGVTFKAFTFPNFYDPIGVKQVGADVAGTFTGLSAAPFELKLPESVKFQDARQKYVPNGAGNLSAFTGWQSADFTTEILQSLGACPTRDAFIAAMQSKGYDGHGTLGTTVKFHQPNLCSWYAKITANGYEPVGNKPVCGQQVTAS